MCIKLARLLRMKRFKKEELDRVSPRKTPVREKTFTSAFKEEQPVSDDILLKAVQEIEDILNKEFREDDVERLREEKDLKFKFAAKVVDRFFFWLSIIYFIITFTALVLAIPNFYKLS